MFAAKATLVNRNNVDKSTELSAIEKFKALKLNKENPEVNVYCYNIIEDLVTIIFKNHEKDFRDTNVGERIDMLEMKKTMCKYIAMYFDTKDKYILDLMYSVIREIYIIDCGPEYERRFNIVYDKIVSLIK